MTTRQIEAAAVVMGLWLTGCGPLRYHVLTDPKVPGGDADLTAKVNQDQGQTHVGLRVANLPPPERIQAGGARFVLWNRVNSTQVWSRVGALEYSEKERSGTLLDATVPQTEFDLELTVESEITPATPSPEVLFTQHVGGPKA